MAQSNEMVLKSGGLTYEGDALNMKNWSLRKIEKKNYPLIGFIMSNSKKERRHSRFSKMAVQCVLTNNRFIVGKDKLLKDADDGVSVDFVQGGDYLGIPLAKIVIFKKTRSNSKIFEGEFLVKTKDSSYRFTTSNPDEWEVAFREALAKRETEPAQAVYCETCGKQIDAGIETCPDCGFSTKGDSHVSEKTKAYITKMWLFGLCGTLGLHYFSSGRRMRGTLRLIVGLALWFLAIVFVYGSTQTEGLTRLCIASFVALFFLPVIDLILIRTGKFRDVYKKYVTL